MPNIDTLCIHIEITNSMQYNFQIRSHEKFLVSVTVHITFEQPIKKNLIFYFAEFDVFHTLSGPLWVVVDSFSPII